LGPSVKLTAELGYLRVGVAIPQLRVADVDYNVQCIIETLKKAASEGVQLLAFPEMAMTGYTLGDLVQHRALLAKAARGLEKVLAATVDSRMAVILGVPLSAEQKIFNSAVVINTGRILGAVPKTFLPDYKEFYEDRWFEPGDDSRLSTIELAGQQVAFGNDILFKIKGSDTAIFGVEICEDLWVPLAPHEYQSVAGAILLFNISASNEVLGKSDWRRTMVASESGRCLSAYCYVSCGSGESSNDVTFGGHAIIAENGLICAESERFARSSQLLIADIDTEKLAFDRRMATSFHKAGENGRHFRIVETEISDPAAVKIWRDLDPHPFVPSDISQRSMRCKEVFSMQVSALAQKLTGAGIKNLVLGISGGLDSTLALLAAVKTMDYLGLPHTNIHAYTLPGFGTTPRTKNNATKLCKALEVNFKEVSIVRTCTSYLKDLEHAGEENIVFENAQARYRTSFLFNKANELSAVHLGTGDLTEVALGWSTFAGDQISHYHINVSVPKTLVRYLVSWVADIELVDSPARRILNDILKTPISPELLSPKNGRIAQKSEDVIGPVELADFYLYPFIRFGMKPGRILFMANEVSRQGRFESEYTLDDLYKWLKSFIVRFFLNQFKRTCMPEGPKVGSVSLSPRGDWRMPSDAVPNLWLEDLEEMYKKLKLLS
jgi:NAD+ synthase (glutamine-hydrolysing)